MSKIEAIATVILVTILLAVALVSQADAKVQGIPVRFCIGAYDNGNGYSCHAWNRVKLNGTWYWVDETMEQPLTKRLWWDYKKPMEQW